MGGFKSNSAAWLKEESRVLDKAEELVTQVMLIRSDVLAPYDQGDLVSSGRVEKNPLGGRSVVFGGPSAPHARRRHFENKKNPQTLEYLKRGGDSVAKESIKKYVDMAR